MDGFTLMELIVVIILIGIITAGVVPVFSGSFAYVQTDHAIRDLIAAVKFGQERAVTDTIEYRLYLDPDAQTYQIMRFKGIEDKKKVFEPLPELAEKTPLPERVRIERVKARKDRDLNAYYIAFYPNGACDDADIQLRRERGRAIHIDTHGALGRLEVRGQ